jgi:hypothetical protein
MSRSSTTTSRRRTTAATAAKSAATATAATAATTAKSAATATAATAATTAATATACPRAPCTDGAHCYKKQSCKTTKQLQIIAGTFDRSKQGLYKKGHHTRCGDDAVVSTIMGHACPNGLYSRDYEIYKEECKQAEAKIKKCDGSDSKRQTAEGLKNKCVSLRKKFRDNLYKPNPIADRGSYVGHQDAIGVIETQFRNFCTGSRSIKKSSSSISTKTKKRPALAWGRKQKRRSKYNKSIFNNF